MWLPMHLAHVIMHTPQWTLRQRHRYISGPKLYLNFRTEPNNKHTRISFHPNPHVMPYQDNKPVKDVMHMEVTLTLQETQCGEKSKPKTPSKVNTFTHRLHPALTQRA